MNTYVLPLYSQDPAPTHHIHHITWCNNYTSIVSTGREVVWRAQRTFGSRLSRWISDEWNAPLQGAASMVQCWKKKYTTLKRPLSTSLALFGLSPLPGCQSPPGLWTIFSRESQPKPSFPLLLGGGTTHALLQGLNFWTLNFNHLHYFLNSISITPFPPNQKAFEESFRFVNMFPISCPFPCQPTLFFFQPTKPPLQLPNYSTENKQKREKTTKTPPATPATPATQKSHPTLRWWSVQLLPWRSYELWRSSPPER